MAKDPDADGEGQDGEAEEGETEMKQEDKA
jgi:hypothetical protein